MNLEPVKLDGSFKDQFLSVIFFSFLIMGSVSRFICQKIGSLIQALFSSVSIYFLPFFSLVFAWFSRLQKHGDSLMTKKTETEENGDHYEEHESEVFLKFKFPTLEEFSEFHNKNCSLFHSEVIPFASISAYEETEISHLNENNGNGTCDLSEDGEGFFDINLEQVGDINGKLHDGNLAYEVKTEEFLGNQEDFLDDSLCESDKNSVESDTDSPSDGFLSDKDLNDEFRTGTSDSKNELLGFKENQELLQHFHVTDDDPQNLENLNSDFLSQADFRKEDDSEFATKDQSEELKSKDSPNSHSGDANKLESLWEHQELIEQLKMELRKVRATGLPTILEESESPRIVEDVKPWKIDESFHHEDCIGELHKFFKSYGERMRKLDILNYQKMYAIGFLQLKDPLHSIPPSPPTLRSLVSQNLWQWKHKIHGSDPMKKFINELHGDLEVVYVGQICLSWEFLHWQYEKALDLWDSDPRGIHRYNEVAGEFQQFQVLIQRFIEDEPFQGPRVQNYVKNRCVLRNLLQVPLIREDKMKDKKDKMKDKKSRKNDRLEEYVVASGMLVEIMEESIRLFWRFIGADKNCTITSIKKAAQVSNSEDNKLLLHLKKDLLKKERKIKDILRSENCILRRFRRSRDEDEPDQVLYFFSQVDMKLVSRVLSMSRVTRDQLVWCQSKLSRISFVNRRKIQVQPTAFLLFPC